MARGTDDYTVQQLMNYLGEQIQILDDAVPDLHRQLGYSYMANGSGHYFTEMRQTAINENYEKRGKLQELLWDVERKCGELWDARKKEETECPNGSN